MAARCAFAAAAEVDLTEIALFIATDTPRRALTFVAEIRERCQAIAEQPAACRLREEYGAGVRVAVHGRYLIFYAERDEAVVIERILHSARHLDWVQL
ncbi:type II toxin-antitoxin system RelE/ParE family toxin [Starkeya sp. ORNL1]|uniref:type II toxin-antitoxin system RelE/ParE family toxin n=1 Tax=Starkeya sp. ORNL1 TaxID=2709380 RepID=UPI00146405A3|nr:type II toxin-antitoxin system RelE/ParE family toxin [Starkeya sp. ORNL1]QJP15498.1 type II toxin-antitoxin system RelE/ParE family toxin [Starkeya sp. ORNL1]